MLELKEYKSKFESNYEDKITELEMILVVCSSIRDLESYQFAIDSSIECLKRIIWADGRIMWTDLGFSSQLCSKIKKLVNTSISEWTIHTIR
jgi:hypothetical protein